MFDLDREIDSWCQQVLGARCINTAGMDELVDHLYCEVEKLRGQGMTAEEAFTAATTRMGDTADLAKEYNKNYGAFAGFFQKLMRLEHRETRMHYRLFIGHALVWAVAILVAALVAVELDIKKDWGFIITLVLIFGFFASEQLLRRSLYKKNQRSISS